ncbi:hypothetical protein H5T53_00695 [Candidatus Bipolaricaulota bacterium]|nr:hypothetical protein [Candidatus Bipolaricaulota bacterium]
MYDAYFVSGAGGVGPFSLGITGKLYSFVGRGQSARGIGFDAGGLYRLQVRDAQLCVALVSSDIGWTTIRWDGLGYPAIDHAAWVTRLGMALTFAGPFGPWRCAADLEVALRRPPYPGEEEYLARALQISSRLGGELWLEAVVIRTGITGLDFASAQVPAQLTFGIGVQVLGVTIDAAWVAGPLGFTYLLSAEFYF